MGMCKRVFWRQTIVTALLSALVALFSVATCPAWADDAVAPDLESPDVAVLAEEAEAAEAVEAEVEIEGLATDASVEQPVESDDPAEPAAAPETDAEQVPDAAPSDDAPALEGPVAADEAAPLPVPDAAVSDAAMPEEPAVPVEEAEHQDVEQGEADAVVSGADEPYAAGPEALFLYLDRSELACGSRQAVAVVFDDPDADVVDARLRLEAADGSERLYDATAVIGDAALFEFDVWVEGVFQLVDVAVAFNGGASSGRTFLGTGLSEPVTFHVGPDVAQTYLAAGLDSLVTTTLYAEDGDSVTSDVSGRPHFNLGYDGILTIAIDPGHGGSDEGASAGDFIESEMTWAVALKVKDILEEKGVTCVLTRAEDECPSLVQRAEVARDAHADFYLCLHFNAAEGSDAHGVEVYYPTEKTSWKFAQTSVPGKDLAEVVYEKIMALGFSGRGVYDRILHPSDPDAGWHYAYPGNPQDTSDYYGLIREPRRFGIPAVVVEHAFITSDVDAALLADETMLDKLAQADAEAVLECFDGAEKLVSNDPPHYDEFFDCTAEHWAYSEGWLEYVVENGIMTGLRDADGTYTGLFAPDADVTRGQVATIIYRYAVPGSDATTNPDHYGASTTFTDVGSNVYYTAAIEWCYANKVITGYSDAEGNELHLFGPDDPVTREQLATMMYRFVKVRGMDVGVDDAGEYDSLPDVDEVSGYARDAMKWCYANGVLTGDKSTDPPHLNPGSSASRAHIAKIITVVTRDILK